jgi:hypothetical protein
MKKLLLITLLAISFASCKKDTASINSSSKLSSQLVGNWLSTKNVTYYTDSKGAQQEYNDGTIYTYSFDANGTVKKKSGSFTTYSATYATSSSNGNDFVSFSVKANLDGTGTTTEVDTYKIITLTDKLLIIQTLPSSGIWSITDYKGNKISGTNSYGYESYTKQ